MKWKDNVAQLLPGARQIRRYRDPSDDTMACLVLMVSLIVVGGEISKRDAEENSHDYV